VLNAKTQKELNLLYKYNNHVIAGTVRPFKVLNTNDHAGYRFDVGHKRGFIYGDVGGIMFDSSFYDMSNNQFLWAIRPSSSQRKAFVRNMTKNTYSPLGLTHKGLRQFVNKLKSEPFYKMVDKVTVMEHKHNIVIEERFKDKKGQKHSLYINVNPNYYEVYMDMQTQNMAMGQ